MHIGTQNFGIQNHTAQRATQEQNRAPNQEHSGSSGRGERLVARHDSNNDAKLSIGELQDTRLGKKMSIDRFARLDKNGDGQLEAGELNRKGHHDGPSQPESALAAKFADLLAAPAKPPEVANLGEDIAKALLARLDKDDSGGLNSQEIAGSRLAEKIGPDFYELDGDKNGTLDTAELSAFITSQFLDAAQSDEMDEVDETDEVDEIDEMDETDETDEVDEIDDDTDMAPLFSPIADEVIAGTTTNPVNPAGTMSESSYFDSVLSSSEAALELLQQGAEQQQSTVNLVRTLYAEANKAFG